jgi:hypothetical protein
MHIAGGDLEVPRAIRTAEGGCIHGTQLLEKRDILDVVADARNRCSGASSACELIRVSPVATQKSGSRERKSGNGRRSTMKSYR